MRRKIMGWYAAALVGGLSLVGVGAAEQRLVFVNMDRIFNEFYKTKLADAQLKEQAAQVMEERKKLGADFEKLQQEFNKLRDDAQNTALNEDVRAQRRTAAEEKLVEVRDFQAKITRFDDTRRKQMEDQSRRMRKRIVDEIRETIQTYARNQMYSAVLDTSGQTLNGIETVLYMEPRLDMTSEIINVLNQGRPTDTTVKPEDKSKAATNAPAAETKADAKAGKK